MHVVIFDVDGTLIQSVDVDDRLYKHAIVAVLGQVQFRSGWAKYDYVSDAGILSQVFADNGIANTQDLSAEIQSRFVTSLEAHIAENGPFVQIPGATAMLESLRRSNNHRIAIATGCWRASAQLKLRSARFDTQGIPLATSDDHHDRSRIMLKALSELGAEFESITYYGDGAWDRDACRTLGWAFVPVGPAMNGLESYHTVRFS